MTIVYKADDAVLGRCVALKVLHRRYAEEISFRLRFKEEARVMASLDHENIVKVYDIFQEGEIPFIVVECVDGLDMGSMLRSASGGHLGEQFTKKIAAQLLEALAYAHICGVMHGDIKPSNILLTKEGVVKIADFGAARVFEDERVKESGEAVGSIHYMSPEQFKGGEISPQSDLYSVGILLYHCLMGSLPFSGNARSVARQQTHKSPTPLRKSNKEISAHLEAVILKALAKNPRDRHPSASAMLEDLQQGAAGSAGVAQRASKGRKALLAFSMLALLLLGGGTTAGRLGYLDLKSLPLPWQVEKAITPPAKHAAVDPPQTPEAAQEPEPSPQEPQQAVALVPVPNVNTYFDYFAKQTLTNNGFNPQVVYGYRAGYAPRGVTWGTDPAPGTPMPPGSTVTVYATPKDQVQPQIRS